MIRVPCDCGGEYTFEHIKRNKIRVRRKAYSRCSNCKSLKELTHFVTKTIRHKELYIELYYDSSPFIFQFVTACKACKSDIKYPDIVIGNNAKDTFTINDDITCKCKNINSRTVWIKKGSPY